MITLDAINSSGHLVLYRAYHADAVALNSRNIKIHTPYRVIGGVLSTKNGRAIVLRRQSTIVPSTVSAEHNEIDLDKVLEMEVENELYSICHPDLGPLVLVNKAVQCVRLSSFIKGSEDEIRTIKVWLLFLFVLH